MPLYNFRRNSGIIVLVKTMRKNTLRHLTKNERAALDRFVAQLHDKYADQIVRVVLFGSKARGDFDAESDLDVFVLVKSDDWRLQDRIATLTSPISLEYNTLLSPKVIGPSLYRRMRQSRSFFLQNVSKEGTSLWTRPLAKRSAKTLPTAAMN